jgi:glyoxylase-like metal-dependent hydrolase (beta-lactamase superfamily II)
MPGIHRERPGADAIAPCNGEPASDLGEGIWMSKGLSNSYVLDAGSGRIVVNTGMGFEGPLHRRAFEHAVPGSTMAIVLTQGHYDHVGGVDCLRDEDTEIVAQANWGIWRADNERLETFRSRNAAFAWIDAILAAVTYSESVAPGETSQSRPEPTVEVDDRLRLKFGNRRIELVSTPGGETTDSLIIWLPESRTLFTGNLFGPLFGHVPNLVTMRGDRYRDALAYIDSLDVVLDLAPHRLITGHFDPIVGTDLIAGEVKALRDSMQWVHDRTIEGMNAGTDVHTLMSKIRLPAEFDLGEGYGKTSWNVRAIWENYSGWFHHRSTTELYHLPPTCIAPEVVAAAGVDALVAAAETRLANGEAVAALHLTDLVLSAEPTNEAARRVAAGATRELLSESDNFWERAWLERSLRLLESGGSKR